ncbi:MAG: YtxH domain-containing protein [Terracidiphilus sp.]
MADEGKSSGFAWFLAGLGVGAVIALLYAPKKGSELREDIALGAREGSEYLRARTREAADNVTALVGKGKERVGDAVDRGRAQWEEFVERGKNLVNDQTTRVSAAVEAGRTAYQQAAAVQTVPTNDHEV